MYIRKIAYLGSATLFTCAAVWLLVWFSPSNINWQYTLYQIRWGLLAWRLLIYGCITILAHRLFIRQKYINKKIIGWSVVLLIICEISNLLQWRTVE